MKQHITFANPAFFLQANRPFSSVSNKASSVFSAHVNNLSYADHTANKLLETESELLLNNIC